MEPLDLRMNPPRSCYATLAGLMLMPRTIDKLRAMLPGGHTGNYFINGRITGISGFLLERLRIREEQLLEVIAAAENEEDVENWLRQNTDTSRYEKLNRTLAGIEPNQAQDPEYFRELYAETMRQHPDLVRIVDIIDADDRRSFCM